MGNAYILWVYEDCVREAKHDLAKYSYAIGNAVIRLCRDHMSRASDDRSEAVLNHTNCVMRAGAGEVHSTWQQVYLWSSNCLRAVYDLEREELLLARQLIDEELQKRESGT